MRCCLAKVVGEVGKGLGVGWRGEVGGGEGYWGQGEHHRLSNYINLYEISLLKKSVTPTLEF